MKNLLGSFKKNEFKMSGIEFLNENEMQQIRGGGDRVRPSSRPREVLDTEEL